MRPGFKSRLGDTYVSAVTAWELATKVRLGKWPDAKGVADDIVATIASMDLAPLAISIEHGHRAGALPGSHEACLQLKRRSRDSRW